MFQYSAGRILEKSVKKIYVHRQLLFLISITVLGFLLRFLNLGSFPLWVDEAITGRAAIGLIEQGTAGMFRYDGDFNSYSRGLLYTYQVALSYKLFGINEITTRLPGIFWGTILIPISYVFGTKFANKETGFILAILVSILPIEIAASRYWRFYSQFQTLFILSLIFFYLWISKFTSSCERLDEKIFNKTNCWLLLWIFTLLSGYYTHRYFVLMIIIPIIFLFYWYLANIYSNKTKINNLYFLLILSLGSICLLLIKIGIGIDIFYYLNPSLFDMESSKWMILFYSEYFAFIFWLSLIGILLVIIHEGDKGKYLTIAFVVSLSIISVLIPAFMADMNQSYDEPRYSIPVLPLFLFFSSYALAYLSRRIYQMKIRNIVFNQIFCYTVIITFILLLVPISQSIFYMNTTGNDGNVPFYKSPNYTLASDFVLDNMGHDDAIYVREANVFTFYFGWDKGNVKKMRHIEYNWANHGFHQTLGRSIQSLDELKIEINEDQKNNVGSWFVLDSWYNIPINIPQWIKMTGNYLEIDDEIAIYYVPPFQSLITFDDNISEIEDYSGNVGIIKDKKDFKNYLALGRNPQIDIESEKISCIKYINKSEDNFGIITIKSSVDSLNQGKMIVRCYGSEEGNRYTKISLSNDTQNWDEIINNYNNKWKVYEVNISKSNYTDFIYVKMEGGSDESDSGGLVDYIRIF